MKMKNQILVIKICYLLILVFGIAYHFEYFLEGFNDGIDGSGAKSELSWLSTILMMISAGIGASILVKLYAFINSTNENSVFSSRNIGRLTTIGWCCVLQSFLVYAYYVSKLEVINLGLLRAVSFDFWLLLFGLTLLTISFVFKKGLELQQEQEFTI
ncbi:MAG: DUF2975 domain-containing protein [Flavobacteriales bacterium]|nr:MAG: DUF2975 domain-containing protein [Flavobacteriales bacterium]